jgi:hypothetical protein
MNKLQKHIDESQKHIDESKKHIDSEKKKQKERDEIIEKLKSI